MSLQSLLGTTAPSTAPPKQPYAPTRRISPADSVLVPISRTELVQCQSSTNPLRTRPPVVGGPAGGAAGAAGGGAGGGIAGLPAKPNVPLPPRTDSVGPVGGASGGGRKRPVQQQEYDAGLEARKRVKGTVDTRTVAEHYNARPNTNREARNDSPIIGLKKFNNWIKSVLIAKHGRRENEREKPPIRVLDLGCGKGGDLKKWQMAGTEEYVGIDIAVVSVEQARDRYEDMHFRRRGDRFPASFFALDCFESSIEEVLDPSYFDPKPFDIVSMQFCMHYAFETEAKVRQMLQNVSRFLKPGGRFVGTIPDAQNLFTHLDDSLSSYANNPDPSSDPTGGLAFGNSIYRVQFNARDAPLVDGGEATGEQSAYGHRYTFFLQDAVEEVPEYVVYWENFVALAAEYSLSPIYCADFQTIFADEQADAGFHELLLRMKVMDEEGNAQMDEDQLDAAMLYMGFAFVKTDGSNPVEGGEAGGANGGDLAV
ncbi:hypothetical protein JCM6882_007681 [Rhodosporidiobolus microsporus]